MAKREPRGTMRSPFVSVVTLLFILPFMSPAGAEESPMSDQRLREAIRARLEAQMDDPKSAEVVSRFVMDEVLTWKAQTTDIQRADSILAFAFGNQFAPNGNLRPGPMNQQLADLVVEIHRQINKPVYAQWEIAEAIGARIPEAMLTPIYPTVSPGGDVVYLSTSGVASAVVKHAEGVEKLGRTVVIAFREHNLRAVRTARSVGLDAYAPAGIALPSHYDEQSGQPWTRNRLAFVLYEIRTRANALRARLAGGKINKK